MSTTNWRPPPSEALRALRIRLRALAQKLRAESPSASDDDIADAMVAEIGDTTKALNGEILEWMINEEIDATCFVYGADKRIMPDDKLRQMTEPELAAWCGKTGVMFAQVKAHIAERFPETRLKVVSSDGGKS
jgi:hypothetical protein